MRTETAKNIDEYIRSFPGDIQARLQKLRSAIQKAAPEAEETINYAIPTFRQKGNLVHFAAFKNHIGFYPGPSGIEAFKNELSVYSGAKGSVQFPLDMPLPLELVSKIVKYRVKENAEKKGSPGKKAVLKDGNRQEKSTTGNFLSSLASPARRALEDKGIKTLQQLSNFSEADILQLHGLGKSSLPALRSALAENSLSFKQ